MSSEEADRPSRKSRSWIRLALLPGIVAVCTGLAYLLDQSSIGRWTDLRAYDLHFPRRGPIAPSPSAPITMVGIDEESLDGIPEPLILWNRHFARLLEALTEAGAACVGVDFIFGDVGQYDSEGQQALSAALLQAGASGMPVVLGYRERRQGPEQPPAAVLFAATAAAHPTAFVNLTTDPDDFVRRQRTAAGSDAGVRPGFALAVARAFGARTGNRVTDPAEDGVIWINFREPGHFPRVSFVEAVRAAEHGDRDFLRSRFRGRIVLIGRLGLEADEDLHSTPQYYWKAEPGANRPRRTPGLEIHANSIATILDGKPIRTLGAIPQFAIAAALTGLVTLLGLFLPSWVALAAAVLLLGGYLLFGMDWTFARGWALPAVFPVVGSILAGGLTQGVNFVLEGREKRRLRRLFRRYVDDRVIAKILEAHERLVLVGERRRISVLFADIQGFTHRSEATGAEELVSLLNRYFTAMVDAIQSNEGMVDKFIGDGIMAIFGSPLEHQSSELHAVRAARAMLAALRSLNHELESEGIKPIRIGVGIHSGEAVVGNIGSARRLEYTAIGDVVNVAARIEGLTRKHSFDIIVSGATFEAVRDAVAGRPLGEEKLKGREEPVEVYGIAPDDETAPRTGVVGSTA